MTIVYKTVSIFQDQDQEKFYSICFRGCRFYPSCLEYRIGQATIPVVQNAPLFAFRSLEEAREYLAPTPRIAARIFKAEANLSSVKLPRHLAGCVFEEGEIADFWAHPKYTQDILTPKGTVLCDSITLLESV